MNKTDFAMRFLESNVAPGWAIEHPTRVALQAQSKFEEMCGAEVDPISTETVFISALVHDLVEDTDVTHDDIMKYFGKTVAKIVWFLTNVPYVAGNRSERVILDNVRLSQAPLMAKVIKSEDIRDNIIHYVEQRGESYFPHYLQEKKKTLLMMGLHKMPEFDNLFELIKTME